MAYLGASDTEQSPTADPSVVDLELTANPLVAIWVTLEAVHLLGDVLRTYDQRSGSHLADLVRWPSHTPAIGESGGTPATV